MKRRPLPTGRRERDHEPASGRFKPGNRAAVGNPQRSRSSRLRRQLVEAIEDDLSDLVAALVSKCKRGDVQALKLALSYGVGSPPSKPGAVDELTGERLSTLITRTQQIKPRDIREPDQQLTEDVSTLAELGLPADGIANLVGIDAPVLHEWLQDGDADPDSTAGQLVRGYAAGLARYRLRLGLQSEARPLSVLERRDPRSYGTAVDLDTTVNTPDDFFL